MQKFTSWDRDTTSAVIDTLKEGEKYTYIKLGDFGFKQVCQFTHIQSYVKPWAQYNNNLNIVFKPKGKRNPRILQMHGIKDITIFKGWVNISDEPETTILSENKDCKVSRYNHSCFDFDQIENEIKKSNSTPLIQVNPK